MPPVPTRPTSSLPSRMTPLSIHSSCCPVFDRQPRHSSQVAVRTDNGTIAECQSDGSDLNIDLLHRPTEAAQLSKDAAKCLGRLVGVRPDRKSREGAS